MAAAILAITALSFLVFPGHSYLQQDTQIYAPILEHQWNGALSNDLVVQRPHVNFTLYDELTDGVRWITRVPLRPVLQGEQLLFRALGFWGVFLIAVSLRLDASAAVVVTALAALGATISGPAVLTVEYEPTPRAFAVPLLLLACGFLLCERPWVAGIAAGCAFLLHAPTTWPVLLVLCALTFVKPRYAVALIPVAVAALALLWIGFLQPVTEAQHFLDPIPPQQEMLQLMRASYNYVSTWWAAWMGQYCLFAAIGFLALWRSQARRAHWVLLGGLVAAGLLSVPLSWMLLEHEKLAVIPQIQPMRALLFVSLVAAIGSSVAGCLAANARRRWEAAAWFAFSLLLPVQARFFEVPGLRVLMVITALSAMLATQVRARMLAALLLAPALAWPGGVVNSRPLETSELAALAEWARMTTPADAVFAFPEAARDRSPGWFRAVALRAVYVDWKGGGQVNYLRDFGYEWWRRWQAVMTGPRTLKDYQALGIDYLVLPRAAPGADLPKYSNSRYVVYRVIANASR